MSTGYTKLFNSITDSTIWSAPDTTRLVWITMLAMSDQNGEVAAAVPGLAARARVPIDACLAALESFLAPDRWSRTPDNEGRRIEVIDGGWRLLNHAKYRAILSAESRREQSRLGMQKKREETKKAGDVSNMLTPVNVVSCELTMLTHTDTYTNTDTKADTNTNTDQDQRQSIDCAGPERPTLTAGPERPTVPRPRKLRTVEPSKTAATWDAYSIAYQDRYGVPPVRNAQVNGQIKNLVARIGADEAPHVAAFYVSHNGGFYVGKMHPVGLLLSDAEKLRTEWATGRQVTAAAARQVDRKQANFDVAEECRRLDREQGIVRTFGGKTFDGGK